MPVECTRRHTDRLEVLGVLGGGECFYGLLAAAPCARRQRGCPPGDGHLIAAGHADGEADIVTALGVRSRARGVI
jgi:hypothetical protein